MCLRNQERWDDLGTVLQSRIRKHRLYQRRVKSLFVLSSKRDISIVVHGDDLTAMSSDLDLDWYTTELKKVFEINVRGRLGEGTTEKEIRILKHYELVARSLGLEAGTPVFHPGVNLANWKSRPSKVTNMLLIGRLWTSQGVSP